MKTHRTCNEARGAQPVLQLLEQLARYVWTWLFGTGKSEQPSVAVRAHGISYGLAAYVELTDKERKKSFGCSAADHHRHRTTVAGQSVRAQVRRPVVNIRDGSMIDQIVPGSGILRILGI